MQIMIVEDDQDIRENLTELFECEGYSVCALANGKEALEALRAQTSLPKLIILDIMMPKMNGNFFLTELSRDSRLKDLPVVVITAATKKITEKIAGLLSKPLDVTETLAMVEKFMK